MKRIWNLLSLLICTTLICCSSNDEVAQPTPIIPEEPNIELTPTTLQIDWQGGERMLEVKATDEWELILPDQWITAEPMQGMGNATVALTIEVNNETNVRQGAITLRCGEEYASSTLTQSGSPQEPDPEPDPMFIPEGYTLIWNDEFDGKELDYNNWTPEIGRGQDGWGNNELQYYTDREENLRVEEGALIITAIKERYQGAPVTSARLITKNKFYFTYGYVVASIKLPKTANGLWPAFWMMGNDFDQVGWPKCGETDILEMGNSGGIATGLQERFLNGAMHWGPRWDQHMCHSYSHTHEYSVQDGAFHTFTCIWDEEMVRMYIDLEKYPETPPYFEMNIAAEQVYDYFHKPNFLLLNLAVGGNFPGIHDIDGVTALNEGEARMEVEYIRVFQRK